MELKSYYRKIREIEAGIAEDDVVVVSRAASNGGRDGVLTEVPRAVAARMIAQGVAELAPADRAAAFRERIRAQHLEEETRRAAARIQVNVISEADARLMAGDRKRK